VLVVDDDEVVRDVVVRYLDREGFESRQAADGEAARRAISEQSPTSSSWTSCCPEMNGLDVCRWVRSVSQVPIILLTARGEESDRIIGLELGADDYVVKPSRRASSPSGSRPCCAARRRPPHGSSRLEVGGLVIDAETREVTRRAASSPHRHRVRPAVVPGEPPAGGVLERAAARHRLGL